MKHVPRLLRSALACALAGAVLANLASAGASWWLARESEREHPPVGEIVQVDGLATHYLRRGPDDGQRAARPPRPTLVLLHGASTSLLDFVPTLLPRLAERFDVIAIDRPGHGYSERADGAWPDPAAQARHVAGLLERLGVRDAVWIGHSWSGSVVLAALRDLSGTDISAGVLLAGAIYPWDTGSAWHAEVAATPWLGEWFAWSFIEPVGRLALGPAIEQVFSPEPVPPGYIDATGTVLSLRPETYRHNAADLTRLSPWLEGRTRDYPSIERPVLSITGDADHVVPAWNHADRLEAALPETDTVYLRGAGHGLVHTRVGEIVRQVESFVARKLAVDHADG